MLSERKLCSNMFKFCKIIKKEKHIHTKEKRWQEVHQNVTDITCGSI